MELCLYFMHSKTELDLPQKLLIAMGTKQITWVLFACNNAINWESEFLPHVPGVTVFYLMSCL